MPERGLIARLRDPAAAVRAAALAEVERVGVGSFPPAQLDALVDALRIAVRVGPGPDGVTTAIALLGQLGPRGAAAALDICRALGSVVDPDGAGAALVAFVTLPAPARAILEAYARDARAEVAAAATRVLTGVLFQSVHSGARV